MKLAITIQHAGNPRVTAERAASFEKAGVDVIWVPELYGFDAVSTLGFLAAKTERVELAAGILPVYSRTPALIAMTAAGLDTLSDGRFVLGLGTSGPQVIEGWHGVPFDTPLAHTEEVVEICRQVWRREVLTHDGAAYQVPLPPSRGTGLAKPLKLINHPVRASIPIYVASLGPKNVQMTARIADGWLPTLFHPDKAGAVWGDDLAAGLKDRDPSLGPLEVVAGGTVCLCDDDHARRIRDGARSRVALSVGGMGARTRNFYNNVFRRYGYEAEAEAIQDAYLDGRREEAEALVPADYLEAVSLAGEAGRVRERIDAYRAAGVTQLRIDVAGDDQLRTVATIKEWLS